MWAAWALLASASAANAIVCSDLPGSVPISNASGATCADYVGWCDAEGLSVGEKAQLMLHCPSACKGTEYSDGGGHAYCACIKGRDCCFDEPPDCATRDTSTVVAQVMCRRTLGLCKPAATPQQLTPPADNKRRTQSTACSEETAAASVAMGTLVDATRETVSLARQLTTGAADKDPAQLSVALQMFK